MLYLLLVYEIATSTVEWMEAKINKYTRKWLGLSPGWSDVASYFRQAKLKLPLKSIVGESKSGKIRLQMMVDDSQDEVIKSLKATLKTGKKWKVRHTIRNAKDNLDFKEIIDAQTCRYGLKTNEKQRLSETKVVGICKDRGRQWKIPKRSPAIPTRSTNQLGGDFAKFHN